MKLLLKENGNKKKRLNRKALNDIDVFLRQVIALGMSKLIWEMASIF